MLIHSGPGFPARFQKVFKRTGAGCSLCRCAKLDTCANSRESSRESLYERSKRVDWRSPKWMLPTFASASLVNASGGVSVVGDCQYTYDLNVCSALGSTRAIPKSTSPTPLRMSPSSAAAAVLLWYTSTEAPM